MFYWLTIKGVEEYEQSSYDVTVFQRIMSCDKKCYEHTCIYTFAGMHNVIDDVCYNNVNFH